MHSFRFTLIIGESVVYCQATLTGSFTGSTMGAGSDNLFGSNFGTDVMVVKGRPIRDISLLKTHRLIERINFLLSAPEVC